MNPCFMAPAREQGSPRVFISHGVGDRVLPIDRCSRRIAPLREASGYGLTYVEFPDGHIVPEDIARTAFGLQG